MMTNAQVIEQIERLNEWEALLEDVKAQADAIRNIIKEEMDARETEELDTGLYIVRYTNVLSQRFNTTQFKKDYEEIYKHYTKQVASRRFSISC